jgi:hypothetical protein
MVIHARGFKSTSIGPAVSMSGATMSDAENVLWWLAIAGVSLVAIWSLVTVR